VYRVVEALGRLVGRADAATALAARMRADVDAVEAAQRGAPRVRVYYELDPTPYAVGPGSFVGALLQRAGGDNVIPAALGDFPRISSEVVIAGDPEVMLGLSLDDAALRPGWSRLTAVQRRAVDKLTPLEESLVSRPGPRLGEGLAVLARHLHRGAAPAARREP
jgi:iron complex transport system substrate-binding protein